MTIKIALGGDTMVGPGVGEALERQAPGAFFSPEIVEAAQEADFRIVNLECSISARGSRWPAPRKPFFFRAPPRAVEILNHLGVDCVTLANNHSLDYGYDALVDTFQHLRSAGIEWVGAGPDLARARAPVVLERGPLRLAVVGFADQAAEYAATTDRPGTAVADFRGGVPAWLSETLAEARREADTILLTPHWGPNFTSEPSREIRAAAAALRTQATLIAGHSAHAFHGVEGNVIYDMGDFLQTYAGTRAVNSLAVRVARRAQREFKGIWRELRVPKQELLHRLLGRARLLLLEARASRLRDDLGLLFLVTLDINGPTRLEALPLKLAHSHTRLAKGEDAVWIGRRFRRACRQLGTTVADEGGRLVITWP
jgi:poly-gamma-glutamate capsule biosynthesis protein CapA/YwtB (metallophosphatase superfamily)